MVRTIWSPADAARRLAQHDANLDYLKVGEAWAVNAFAGRALG
jgi:hypothetical protein